MWGLVYKDLIINKKSFRALLLIAVFMEVYPLLAIWLTGTEEFDVSISSMLFSLGIMATFITLGESIQISTFKEDEQKKWAYYISSSPLTGVGQVQAKYWFILATTFGLNLFYIFLDGINALIFPEAPSLMILIFIATTMILFLRAIEIPFIVRYGAKYGLWVKTFLFFTIVFVGILYGLFGDLTIFGSSDNFWERFFEVMKGEGVPDGLMLFMGIFPLVTMVLFYGSYKLSSQFYLKGVESFEK